MLDDFEEETAPRSLGRRLGLTLAGLALLGGAAGLATVLLKGPGPASRPHQEPHITQVMLPPPPPPPPPKPTPPPPQKTVVERPREQVSPQKAASRPKAMKLPSPPAAVTTSITGPGPGSLAAGNGGGGDCLGSGCGSGDGTGGDNDSYYSSIVKSQIEAAIRRDEKLRFATYRLRVTFQLDGNGHVTRAAIGSFDGDGEARAEIGRILLEVSTNDAPPAEMMAKTFTVSIAEHVHG